MSIYVDLCGKCRHPGGAHRGDAEHPPTWCTLCDCSGWDEARVIHHVRWTEEMDAQARKTSAAPPAFPMITGGTG